MVWPCDTSPFVIWKVSLYSPVVKTVSNRNPSHPFPLIKTNTNLKHSKFWVKLHVKTKNFQKLKNILVLQWNIESTWTIERAESEFESQPELDTDNVKRPEPQNEVELIHETKKKKKEQNNKANNDEVKLIPSLQSRP